MGCKFSSNTIFKLLNTNDISQTLHIYEKFKKLRKIEVRFVYILPFPNFTYEIIRDFLLLYLYSGPTLSALLQKENNKSLEYIITQVWPNVWCAKNLDGM